MRFSSWPDFPLFQSSSELGFSWDMTSPQKVGSQGGRACPEGQQRGMLAERLSSRASGGVSAFPRAATVKHHQLGAFQQQEFVRSVLEAGGPE